MGKSKKRSRNSNARSNPLLRNAAKDDQIRTKKLQPLIAKLSSVVPNDRSMALSSLIVLCEDPHMRTLLLKEKLVSVITTKLITDSNTDLVVESYGLLRNIVLEEGYDIATHLWRSNIWANIFSGFSQVSQSLQSMDVDSHKSTTESKRLLFDFAENLISLVVALANGSNSILDDIITTEKLETIFEGVVAILKYGISVSHNTLTLKITTQLFNTILDFIFDFSGDSYEFIEKLSSNSYLSEFIRGLPNFDIVSANELTHVLVQGILLQFLDTNMSYEDAVSITSNIMRSIEMIDLKEVREVISSNAEDLQLAEISNEGMAKKIREYAKQKADGLMKLRSIELSLDIITAVIELIGTKYESSKAPLSESLLQTLTESLPTIFLALQDDFTSRVLIGWNNLLWLYLSVGINVFQLGDQWRQLWAHLQNSSKDAEFGIKIEKLSVTWALLKSAFVVFSHQSPYEFFQIVQVGNEQFVKSIIEMFETTSDLEVEEALELKQRCCGVLSTLAMFSGHVPLNGLIGDFYIQLLSNDKTPAPVLADVVNSFFEIYSDKEFDYDEAVFVQKNYLNALKSQVVPNLKKVFKFVDRNKDPELKERCQDCFTTLDSFIHYKEGERK